MERDKGPFQLYRRKTRKSRTYKYYYRVWIGDKRSPGRSTGETSKTAARAYVIEKLKNGTLQVGSDPFLRDYLADFWKWDTCRYVRRKRERGKISEHWAQTQRIFLDKWILPALGDKRLSTLTAGNIEDWLYKLRDEGNISATSINHVLGCLKTMLKEAVRRGDLAKNPSVSIDPLREDRKQKGILDLAQIKLLFDETKIGTYWNGDLRLYTLNLFACTTGARLGECQGLQRQHVHEGWVSIEHGWRRREGLVQPKKGSFRRVPLPTKTEGALAQIMAMSPWQDSEDLVFPGMNGRHPIDQKVCQKRFAAALAALGIDEEQRKARSFHSTAGGCFTIPYCAGRCRR